MKKILYILKEMLHMIKKEKLFFLLPIFITLALLTFLIYHIGPAIVVTFIYAGI